jgi:predicted nucleic acid-binding protein
MIFLDTNILLYLIDQTPEHESKQSIAKQLTSRTDVTLSTQVLIEFCNNAFRPKHQQHPLTQNEVVTLLTSWKRFQIVSVSPEMILNALKNKERFQISHLDALILEAALAAGCKEVYSEDLNNGQNYGGVRVINPFRK